MRKQVKSVKEEILQQITTILNTQLQDKSQVIYDNLCVQDDTGLSRLNVLSFALQIESHWDLEKKRFCRES